MLLIDKEIKELKLVTPCIDKVVCPLSYGLEPNGYTLRLSREFLKPVENSTLDPFYKKENEHNFVAEIHEEPFILKAKSFILAKSIEYIDLPNNVTAIALTKSSYARCGIFANITTIDAGFKGFLVIEIANIGSNDAYIYPEYGIAEILFFKHEETKGYIGNYQNQEGIKV